MDPVSLIVTALANGAAGAIGDAASEAVRGAYQRLKKLVAARFSGKTAAEVALAEHETDPSTWQRVLEKEVKNAGLGDDQAVIEAAQALMGLLDPEGSLAGKYKVVAIGSRGVQVGDHNKQVNDFRTTIYINDPHEVRDVPIIVTVQDYSRSSRLIVDGDPPGPMTLSGQVAVAVTVEGRSSQAVTLERIQPVVVQRCEPRLAMIMNDPLQYKRVTLRYIELDLTPADLGLRADDFSFAVGLDAAETDVRAEVSPRRWLHGVLPEPSRLIAGRLVARDGTPQGPVLPHGGFPYTVTASDPERFIFRPQVTGHEVTWNMRLEWLCAGRLGTTIIDNDGQPFRLYPEGQNITVVPFRKPGQLPDDDQLPHTSPSDVRDLWNRYWSTHQ